MGDMYAGPERRAPNGPSGREWGVLKNEVKHLVSVYDRLSRTLEEMPTKVSISVNGVRAECPHRKASKDHELRLRRIERVMYAFMGIVTFIKFILPHIIPDINNYIKP